MFNFIDCLIILSWAMGIFSIGTYLDRSPLSINNASEFLVILLRLIISNKFLEIKDTQCGFKLYEKNLAKIIFRKMKENGYIHDVEILILIRKNKFTVHELPINWVHKDGSKINIIQDSIKMLIDLFRLKLRYRL